MSWKKKTPKAYVYLWNYTQMFKIVLFVELCTNIHSNITVNKNLHVNVHNSIIHNNPKMETAQIVISWWMD